MIWAALVFGMVAGSALVGAAVGWRLPWRLHALVQPPTNVQWVVRILLWLGGALVGLYAGGLVVFAAFTLLPFLETSGSYEDVLPPMFVTSPLLAAFFVAIAERGFRRIFRLT